MLMTENFYNLWYLLVNICLLCVKSFGCCTLFVGPLICKWLFEMLCIVKGCWSRYLARLQFLCFLFESDCRFSWLICCQTSWQFMRCRKLPGPQVALRCTLCTRRVRRYTVPFNCLAGRTDSLILMTSTSVGKLLKCWPYAWHSVPIWSIWFTKIETGKSLSSICS